MDCQIKQRFRALKTATSQRKSGVSVLGMFVLSWSRGMISSEDVIGLSVCIPGLLGGVSPAHILEIDLPQRQTLVPGSPAASAGPGDRQQGEMGKDVLTKSCRSLQLFETASRACKEFGSALYSRSVSPARSSNRLFVHFHSVKLSLPVVIRHIVTSPLLSHHQPSQKQMRSKNKPGPPLLWPFDVTLRRQTSVIFSLKVFSPGWNKKSDK